MVTVGTTPLVLFIVSGFLFQRHESGPGAGDVACTGVHCFDVYLRVAVALSGLAAALLLVLVVRQRRREAAAASASGAWTLLAEPA